MRLFFFIFFSLSVSSLGQNFVDKKVKFCEGRHPKKTKIRICSEKKNQILKKIVFV